VFRQHLEAAVLVGDPFDHRGELFGPLDRGGVVQDRDRQVARLATIALIHGIEDVEQLGMSVEEVAVTSP
jgi:hypothetical protein